MLIERNCPFQPERIAGQVTKSGNWKLIQWWQQNYNIWKTESYKHPIYQGDLKMVKWLQKEGAPLNSEVYNWAAEKNQRELIEYFLQENIPWDSRATYWAARTNNFDLLKWLHQHGCPLDNNRAIFNPINGAVSCGNLEMIKWLIEQGVEVKSSASSKAAEKGFVEILDWLIQNQYPISNNLVTRALARKQFSLAKDLYQRGYPLQELPNTIFVKYHPETWEWLLQEGYSFSKSLLEMAIRMRRIEAIQWLHQKNLIENYSELTFTAARYGRLHMLQYLVEEGFEWNPEKCYEAVETGDVYATKNWIQKHITTA
jgi:hypothetical protein